MIKNSCSLLGVICITLVCNTSLSAQNAPVGALPMMYNGGFAGEAGNARVSSYSFLLQNYSTQDIGSIVSYDNFFSKIRSGIGIAVGRFATQPSFAYQFNNTFASISISPKFSFGGKYTVAPFVDFTFINSSTSLYDKPQPPNYRTETGPMRHSTFGQFRSGLLVNTSKGYFGFSFSALKVPARHGYPYIGTHYLDRNLRRFDSDRGILYDNFIAYFQAGYTFQRTPDSKFSFTPQLVAGYNKGRGSLSYGNLFLRELSLSFRYKKFIWGINRTGLALGLQTKKLKIQLSQHYPIRSESRWIDDNGQLKRETVSKRVYSPNLAIRYVIKKKSKSI